MKKYIAEFIGTFMLVFLGTGTVVIAGTSNVLTIGLAFGMAITVMAYTFGAVSGGNFNPAVSIAMVINKRLSLKDGVYYIISQFLGAIVASAFVGIFADSLAISGFGANDFPRISAPMALLVEGLITFIFVLVILMVTSEKLGNATMAPIAIGITLSFLIIVAFNLTGGSLNPARSFGPAIFEQGSALSNYWVFLVAPIIGSVLAAYVAKFMGSEDSAKKATAKTVAAAPKATTTTKKSTAKKTTTKSTTAKKTTAKKTTAKKPAAKKTTTTKK
ncbi:glycerol uptake facilitator protein [Companilactobacillus sp. RD055328]|nr:glycerol uptake facilitator protein [Companilactobacillus sp. RD055328]